MKHYLTSLYIALLMLGGAKGLFAQQVPVLSLYRNDLNMFNPAVVGSPLQPTLGMSLRSQWQGIKDAPETQVFTFATPTKNERVGLGLQVINDQTFAENQTRIFGSFSYKLPLNPDWDLYLGIQAGYHSIRVNASNLDVYGNFTTDPGLVDYSNINPNVGVGAYLKHENYYLSLSAPRILNSNRFDKTLDAYETVATNRVHIYGSAGASFPLNNQWDFVPSVFLGYVNSAPFLSMFNASFVYNKMIDFGVEYSIQSGFGGTLMVNAFKTFSIGYAYVPSVFNELRQFSKGSHELALRIRLGEAKDPLEDEATENTTEEVSSASSK